MENNDSDSEEPKNDFSSLSVRSAALDESSSRLSPNVPKHEASSECECDSCELGSEPLQPLAQCPHDTSEADPDLLAAESEFDESRDNVDLISSPNSNNGFSSCDERYVRRARNLF